MREISRRTWLLTVLTAGLLVVGTGYWGYTQYQHKQRLLTYLNNRNQKAFFEMVSQVENMETLLAKSIASGSPYQRSLLFSNLWMQANGAQNNLGTLPLAHFQVARTAKFLNQVGDFAYALAKKDPDKQQITASEERKLAQLHREAGYLAVELQQMRAKAVDGLLTWGEIENQAPRLKKAGLTGISAGFEKIDGQMQKFPTLIYDGPFSDHIEQKAPKGLTGPVVSATEAKNIAAQYLAKGNKPLFRPVRVRSVTGKIPAYRVYFDPAAGTGPNAVVDVSKKGGHVVMLMVNRDTGGKIFSLRQAENKAAGYLKSRGLINMVPTYSLVQGNNAVISYAYRQNGVLIYPDLIKVKVALDNGDILGLEAMGFLMSHHKRNLPQPKISQAEARRAVNPNLKIREARLAVIPTDTLGEKLVYEFKGKLNGDTFIVYINAMDGTEEKVLKVIETKDGPMTM